MSGLPLPPEFNPGDLTDPEHDAADFEKYDPLAYASSTRKGDLAEAAVLARLIELGHTVLRPVSSDCRYDLAIAEGSTIVRIQCKIARLENGGVRFFTGSSRKRGDKWRRDDYTTDCDMIVAYCPHNRECYGLAAESCPSCNVNLMVDRPLNNQTVGIRFASDYLLEKVDFAMIDAVVESA